ncbi:MAG: thioesterase family protein [Acidimicrobiales bacterium]|nr:thioesterase family protein [Acidimicrobiales bacterium]
MTDTSETDWRARLAGPDDFLVAVDGDTIIPTELCGGPWSPDAQHGSAAAATLAWAIEQVELPVPMRPARFTVDLLSPVPLTPLRWETRIVKAGKRIAVVDAALYDGDRVATRASALLMRSEATIDLPADANQPAEPSQPPREPLPEDDFAIDRAGWEPPGFAFAMDYQRTAGGIGSGAPASIWMRLRTRVVQGEDATPFQWLAAAADMGSQLGGFLPYGEYRTINADITAHVTRLPRSPWIGMDGVHRVAPDAIGQTTATMFDEDGFLATMQSSVHIDRWQS